MKMPSSFEKMCRTCMLQESKQQETSSRSRAKIKVVPQMVSIFTVPEETKVKLNLMELIKTSIPQIKIEANDELPKNVCAECLDKIKEIYKFQQNCLNNEQKFYKMLKENSEEAIISFNAPEDEDDNDDDVFKTEFDDNFMEGNCMQSDEEMIMEEEINRAAEAKEEFIESCSDWSADLDLEDDDSDTEYDPKKTSKLNKSEKQPFIGEEIFNIFCEDEVKEGNNIDDLRKPIKAESSVKINDIESQENYQCNRCNKKLKTKTSLLRHQETHVKRDRKERNYKCNICSKAFRYESMLREHEKRHVGERSYLCSQCGKGFTSAGSLKQHSLRHLEEKLFPCPDCPRSFPTKTDMLSHYDIHKAKPRNHICDVCGRGFYKPYLLKQHKMYHNNERPYSCEYCEKSKTKKSKHSAQLLCEVKIEADEEYEITTSQDNQTTSATRKKKYTKKEKIADDLKPKLYPCDKCKRKLKSEMGFKHHQEKHHGIKATYKCSICSQVLEDKTLFKEHMRSHNGEKVYLCSECGKGYATAGGLKEHSFRHLSEKNVRCPDCPRTFTTKTDLVSHYMVHKAKPKCHICDICGRGFHKPFLLKKHKMYHTNERPFPCEFCEKRFYTNEKLKRHTRIHTGEKPYKCNYCKNAYCQSNELMKHLQIHLGENVYQCEMCPERFKTVKILRSHFATHKDDDEETKARNLAALNALELKGNFFK